jgi:hypothetical protein
MTDKRMEASPIAVSARNRRKRDGMIDDIDAQSRVTTQIDRLVSGVLSKTLAALSLQLEVPKASSLTRIVDLLLHSALRLFTLGLS